MHLELANALEIFVWGFGLKPCEEYSLREIFLARYWANSSYFPHEKRISTYRIIVIWGFFLWELALVGFHSISSYGTFLMSLLWGIFKRISRTGSDVWWYSPECNFTVSAHATVLHSESENYCQTSNISHNLVGNKIVDNLDVVGASPVGAAPTYIFILDLTPGFSELCIDDCKTRQETFKFWDLMCLILEVWWYKITAISPRGQGAKPLTYC